MRHRLFYLVPVFFTAALLPTFAHAQGVSDTVQSVPVVSNTATQSWTASETHFWALNTDQTPAAVATWSLNVPQTGRAYGLQVFIPAPIPQESAPRTNRAVYELRSPAGGVTRFFLNQAVTTSQWVAVPTGFFTFNQTGAYQLTLSGRTSEPAGSRAVVAAPVRLVTGLDPGIPGDSLQTAEERAASQRAFELINQLRQQNGLAPLIRNDALDRAEAGHVRDMARNQFVSSEGSNGLGASQRASLQGYSPRQLTVWISVGEATAEELMRDYPREILDPLYKDIGIAVAFAPNSPHLSYWSVVVATR